MEVYPVGRGVMSGGIVHGLTRRCSEPRPAPMRNFRVVSSSSSQPRALPGVRPQSSLYLNDQQSRIKAHLNNPIAKATVIMLLMLVPFGGLQADSSAATSD